MSKLAAAPSPRGTNFEQLYLRPLGSAFDAAPSFNGGGRVAVGGGGGPQTGDKRRGGRDADPDAVNGILGSLQSHLAGKISGDDLNTTNMLLSQLLEVLAPQDDEGEAAEDRRRMAGDGRTRFPTQAEVDGVAGLGCIVRPAAPRMSADAARRARDDMARQFPNAVMPRQY
jgi:hypothetical protein